MNGKSQGSKKKARRRAYLERQAKRAAEEAARLNRLKRLQEAESLEDMANTLGTPQE